VSVTLSPAEVLRDLRRLAAKWPESLWLFSASGALHLMRTDPEGRRAYTASGSADPAFSIAIIPIPNDGGDW
jgi:hypothetical protein